MTLVRRIEGKKLHPAWIPSEVRRRDIAYASFLGCGLVLAGAFLLNWLPTDTLLYRGFARLYELPILFVFTAGAILGAAFALVVKREWPLHLLLLSTLLAGSTPWLVMRWPGVPDLMVGGYLIAYLLLSVAWPFRWFCVDRKRLLRRYPPRREEEWLTE